MLNINYKRIKESVTEIEYKKLLSFTRGDDSIKPNTKVNLLRSFSILYFTGIRLNELQMMRLSNIKELLDVGSTKLLLPKTKSERRLFAGDSFKKQLLKLFSISVDTDLDARVIAKGSSTSGRTGINSDVFIKQINAKMKEVLGDGYTSHKFIGHSDVKTTMRYINPTDEDLKGAMIR